MTPSLAAVGEISLDVYDDGERRLGGISANLARTAAWCGARATLFASIGDDAEGARIDALAEEAVAASQGRLSLCLRRTIGESAVQPIRIMPTGERVLEGFRPGVAVDYALEPGELAALASFDAVHVPLAALPQRATEQVLASGHPRIAVDVSIDSAPADLVAWLAPQLDRVAFAFVGGGVEHRAGLAALARGSRAVIVLTAGAAGAWAMERGRVASQPTLARTIVDTTGCGDAFQAGFLAHAARGGSLEEALRGGAKAAAFVAAKRGGGPD